MNRYDFLCEQISLILGDVFDIKYFENEEKSWDEILTDDIIHGVMHVVGGNVSYIGKNIIKSEQLSIGLMIPLDDNELFSNAIMLLDNLVKVNGITFEHEGDSITIYYNSRTDASRSTVNGKEYGFVSLNCSISIHNRIILSDKRKVVINGTELEGMINCEYSIQHNSDGDVNRNNIVASNTVNSIADSLSIDIVWRDNDALHYDLLYNALSIKEYTVSYFNGIFERIMKMQISFVSENSLQGDIIKGKLILIRGREHV